MTLEFSNVVILATQRLILSPCRPDDCTDFVALEQDPEVMRHLNGGHPVDRERDKDDDSFLKPTGTESHVWTARNIANGTFVGWFCLWPEMQRRAELGYRLRRDCWGQGLATEGAAALIEWGFKSGGFDRIFAVTLAVNLASRRVLEKAGMSFTRSFHPPFASPFPGSEQGEVEYAVSRKSDESG